MEGPERPVVLYRARTSGERQHIVLAVQKHWERVGQRPREHLFVWDTEDGLPPVDAQLEDTAEAFEALPWLHNLWMPFCLLHFATHSSASHERM